MPPKFNPDTERKILKAAGRLWRKHGEAGLTLRAVAKEAGTTTPTVYKRFRDKQALRVALAKQFHDQVLEEVLGAETLEESYRRYINFASQHPNEYRLLWDSWTEVFRPERPKPFKSWVMAQLAKRHGGNPQDYSLTFYALTFLTHGAAMLLTVPGDEAATQEVSNNYPRIISLILQNAKILGE